jgi:hypothetical protein
MFTLPRLAVTTTIFFNFLTLSVLAHSYLGHTSMFTSPRLAVTKTIFFNFFNPFSHGTFVPRTHLDVHVPSPCCKKRYILSFLTLSVPVHSYMRVHRRWRGNRGQYLCRCRYALRIFLNGEQIARHYFGAEGLFIRLVVLK